MPPKQDAPQSKEVSPSKRVRTAASPQRTSSSTGNEQPVQEQASSTSTPSGSDHAPTSTPSTDTLPSTDTSVSTNIPSLHPTANKQSDTSIAPASMGSAIPTTVSSELDPQHTSTCPERLMKRIRMLSTYSNIEANTFALGHLLPTATWGTTDMFKDRSKIVCNPETNEPINIWILGHITNTWFIKNGTPDNQCSITILPLSSTLGQYASRLLSELSTPTLSINEYDPGLIRAVRWQSPHSGGTPTLFNSIFDVREILKSKSTMPKLDILHLEKCALVLIETHLQRYRQKDEKGHWTISKAQFELQAIYLLQEPSIPDPSAQILGGELIDVL
ncbi:hypothetical protein M404DRAFT_33314 [Pisolithus tinctorius Marx 270]|uniref:Uncharacterized protein n=1 Tax=Pisolithus tinctorius Marx 270 TaxID=870435 RepID=A0A0C3NLC7_PISTI|nr:hypothetical protein M404DRAFT_33314 [Pisolithus tinctorius Marx 270]